VSCDDAPASGHCITCSDEGVPMSVVAVDAERELALCIDDAGARHSVEIALVAPVGLGDEVLVHAAVALVRLQEARA
jgi:hydrogenase maturation factor